VNSKKIDTSFEYDRTHYATIAQVTESALLLSITNNGFSQTVNGATIYSGEANFYDDVRVGQENTPTVFNISTKVTSTVGGPITFNSTAVFNGPVTFNNSVAFTSGLSIPKKDKSARKDVTTEPASEHQVWMVENAMGEVISLH
jgi:hypothetical protein